MTNLVTCHEYSVWLVSVSHYTEKYQWCLRFGPLDLTDVGPILNSRSIFFHVDEDRIYHRLVDSGVVGKQLCVDSLAAHSSIRVLTSVVVENIDAYTQSRCNGLVQCPIDCLMCIAKLALDQNHNLCPRNYLTINLCVDWDPSYFE